MDPIETRLKTSHRIENPRERALMNLFHTAAALRTRFNECFKAYDLTEPQYNVLRILRGQRGAAMNLYAIGDRMVHKESNVSRIVDKLEAKGLVQRKEDETNRRRVDITLLPAAERLLDDIHPQLVRELNACFDGLLPAETEQLSDLLDKLHA